MKNKKAICFEIMAIILIAIFCVSLSPKTLQNDTFYTIKSRSANIKIDMSESGIFLINADNENNQLYLCDSMLAISNDRWLTAKCAIDENGIIGSKACSCNINDAIKLY